MPAVNRPPRYCRQKCKNRADRAYVEIDGRRVWLGTYGTEDSFERYADVIGKQSLSEPPKAESAPSEPTMAVLMVEYLKHAIEKYGGEKSSEVVHLRGALKIIRRTHGDMLAKKFGPKAYQQVRRAMIEADWSRRYIRDQCQRIKRMVAWGVAEELLPANARHALDAVPGLTMGEFNVRETESIEPVAAEVIERTLPHLSDRVADMVRLTRFTAARPGEICKMLGELYEIDSTSEIWLYRPANHKTKRHGRTRTIYIGPQAQRVLAKYLDEENKAATYLHRLENDGKSNVRKHFDSLGYTTASFRRAIHRACDRAFPHPTLGEQEELSPAEQLVLTKWQQEHRWSPNQLRHTAATEIRKLFGLEAAQVMLGHSRADVTQVYAAKNETIAQSIAMHLG